MHLKRKKVVNWCLGKVVDVIKINFNVPYTNTDYCSEEKFENLDEVL